MLFRDRRDAGEQLSAALRIYQDRRPHILAIPRGGVVVGYEVAVALRAPLDVVIPRKLRAPGNPELAIGAVAHDGTVYLDEALVAALRVADDYLQTEIAEQSVEIKRRMLLYRGDRPPPDLSGSVAVGGGGGKAPRSTMIAAPPGGRAVRPGPPGGAPPVAPARSTHPPHARTARRGCLHPPPTLLGRRSVRRLPHGGGRGLRSRRAGVGAASHHQRRRPVDPRPGTVFPGVPAVGRNHRRPHGVSADGRQVSLCRERIPDRARLPVDRRAHPRVHGPRPLC